MKLLHSPDSKPWAIRQATRLTTSEYQDLKANGLILVDNIHIHVGSNTSQNINGKS